MNLTDSSQWATFAHHTQTTFISTETVSVTYVANIKKQKLPHQQCFRLRGVQFQRHGYPLCQGLIYLRANVHARYWWHQLRQILGSPGKAG